MTRITKIFKEKAQSLSCCCCWVNEQKHATIRVIHTALFLDKAASWKWLFGQTIQISTLEKVRERVRVSSTGYASPYWGQIKIFFPDRMKYNPNLNLINFRTFFTHTRKQELLTLMKSGEVQDLTFWRKLRKEPRKDARSIQEIVLNWIEKNQILNKELWLLYNSPIRRQEIFDSTTIQKTHKLNNEYYEILSLVINHETYQMQQRLTRENLPNVIVRLQNIFLESLSTAISAVNITVCASGSVAPGVDGIQVPTLEFLKQDFINENIKGTCYGRSTKTSKIRKNSPEKTEITPEVLKVLKGKLDKQLFDLRIALLQKSNFKSLRKNYKANAVRRVLIPKLNGDRRLLSIPSLRDKVLQHMVYMSLIPIAEYQADVLSFGFRTRRSAIQFIAFIFTRLVKSVVTW